MPTSLATGSVAAGGTLGFLIPPSGGMIIYAVLTEQSDWTAVHGRHLPGHHPDAAFHSGNQLRRWPASRSPVREENASAGPSVCNHFIRLCQSSALCSSRLVGMYTGFFTPVEASSVGAFFTFLVALFRRALSLKAIKTVILQTMNATATVFLIIIGAFVFIPFMSLTELPANLVTILTSLPIGDIGVLLLIILAYMFLGMFLESMAMLVLTIPVVSPHSSGSELGSDLVRHHRRDRA